MTRRGSDGRRLTPLGAAVRGALAGTVGTAAMDLVRYSQYRAGGGMDDLRQWELASVGGWEEAPAAAQVGRRVVEALFRVDLPDSVANRTNNVVHWGYGTWWGVVYGLLAGSTPRRRVRWGPVFASAVWLSDYLVLPPTGLYQPMSEYDARTLVGDWASHLAYGTGLGAAFRALAGDEEG